MSVLPADQPAQTPAPIGPPMPPAPDAISSGGASAAEDPGKDRAATPKASGTRRAIYGSFWLDQTEFAVHADMIREVVNEPEQISAIPLSPAYMVGLFNLRGTIIPIVDLRQLLEFPQGEVAERKIAVIDDGVVCIGLMVDRTGEVLTVQNGQRIDFHARPGQVKDVVVEGLLKLDNGERIVQILDPRELLSLKKVPRSDSERSNQAALRKHSRGGRFNCISFQFGHTTCAIDLRHVQEVRENPVINESILVQDCFVGITNLRGQIIPVADFRNFMGDTARLKSSGAKPPQRKMLVIQTDGGLIGLLVYSINNIMTCFEDDVLQFTMLALPRADVVRGCIIGKQGEIIMLLDYTVLKSDRILADTAQRCQEVHPHDETETNRKRDEHKGPRLTFIVFTILSRFALDTTHVSEVIAYPDTLLKPPYSLDFVDGIVNLRGELITLIDPRSLYGLPPIDRSNMRVLIFKSDNRRYGILVDSVDEIVSTTAGKVASKMTITHNDTLRQIAEDDGGCIQSDTRGAVMLLDMDAFLRRCIRKAGGELPAPT